MLRGICRVKVRTVAGFCSWLLCRRRQSITIVLLLPLILIVVTVIGDYIRWYATGLQENSHFLDIKALLPAVSDGVMELQNTPTKPTPKFKILNDEVDLSSMNYQGLVNQYHAKWISRMIVIEADMKTVYSRSKSFIEDYGKPVRLISKEAVGWFEKIRNEFIPPRLIEDCPTTINSVLPLCQEVSPFLTGTANLILKGSNQDVLKDVLKQHPDVRTGGVWAPSSCRARHKVAIIIPFRSRWRQFPTFLKNILPVLKRQELEFRVILAEQSADGIFNKGTVMNVGFVAAMNLDHFDCVIFHDVDLMPESDLNPYSCSEHPRHIAAYVNTLNYELWYYILTGGALMMKPEHFLRVNGYSNSYWGWGAEDDDLGVRINQSGLAILRMPKSAARYRAMPHKRRKGMESEIRGKLWRNAHVRYLFEGLNTLDYNIGSIKLKPLYTHVYVTSVGNPPENFWTLVIKDPNGTELPDH